MSTAPYYLPHKTQSLCHSSKSFKTGVLFQSCVFTLFTMDPATRQPEFNRHFVSFGHTARDSYMRRNKGPTNEKTACTLDNRTFAMTSPRCGQSGSVPDTTTSVQPGQAPGTGGDLGWKGAAGWLPQDVSQALDCRPLINYKSLISR